MSRNWDPVSRHGGEIVGDTSGMRYLVASLAAWRAARRLPKHTRRPFPLVEHFAFTMLAATVIMVSVLVIGCF